jgi:hypothetical protein
VPSAIAASFSLAIPASRGDSGFVKPARLLAYQPKTANARQWASQRPTALNCVKSSRDKHSNSATAKAAVQTINDVSAACR